MIKRLTVIVGFSLASASCSLSSEPNPSEPVAETALAIDQSFWDLINKIGAKADKASSYYSKAKSAYEMGQYLGSILGLWSINDAATDFKNLTDLVKSSTRALDWKDTTEWIDTQRSLAIPAIDRLKRTGAASISEDRDTAVAATAITSQASFYRAYDDAITDGEWKRVISRRAQPTSDATVYDWRLGVPALMELVSYRVAVIGALDPNFRWDDQYDEELRRLRDSLAWNYQTMLDGIACDTIPVSGHFCADIYTGKFVSQPVGNDESWEVIRARLASQLKQQLPLFAMRSMINTLNLYIGGGQDLTDAYSQISAAWAPNLCLDVPGSGWDAQMPLQVNPCNRSLNQTWTYNRVEGTIVNAAGYCLDVQGGAVMLQTGPRPISSNPVSWPPVWTYWCNGGNAQKWTFDPDTHVLQSALGNVLDMEWGNLAVQARPLDGSPAEQWRGDGTFAFRPSPQSSCGQLKAGEGLLVNQAAWSCNRQFALSLRANGDIHLEQMITFNPPPPPPSPSGTSIERWHTSTNDSLGDILVMQGDGNLVLYNGTGGPVWSSNTWDNPGAYLAIQDDGNLVIYSRSNAVLWATTKDKGYRQHTAPPSLLWYNQASGELSTWALDELGDVTGHRTLSWRCDAACAQTWKVASLLDLNRDGSTDVLWNNVNTGEYSGWLVGEGGIVYGTQTVSAACNPSAPHGCPSLTCDTSKSSTCVRAWKQVAALDLNQDGVTDLIWHNTFSGEVTAWLLNAASTVIGTKTLSWQCDDTFRTSYCSESWKVVSAMDVNGDGKVDLLWHNWASGELAAWLLDKDVTGSMGLSGVCSRQSGCAQSWSVVSAGDFNSDANADLLWYNRDSGDLLSWLTDGAGAVAGSQSLDLRCGATHVTPYNRPSGCAEAWTPLGTLNLR